MKLTSNMAQSIVDKMMEQVPYNINIMDENGYIIASGDKKRINTLHVGAINTIGSKSIVPLKNFHGNNGSPGVNMPIFFDGSLIGVVGITGDPIKVKPLASLVEVTTELLLKQSQLNKEKQNKKDILNHFLYRWMQVTDHLETQKELITDAKKLNVDIFKKRTAIAIKNPKNTDIVIDNKDYLVSFSPDISIIITNLESTISRYITGIKQRKITAGIGTKTQNVGESVNQALKVLYFKDLFHKSDYIFYDEIKFIDMILSQNLPIEKLLDIFNKVSQNSYGKILIQTLISYIQNNGNISRTATALYIHRNTLTHRLKKISKLFLLNPYDFNDLFQLYVGTIYYLDNSQNKNSLQNNNQPE